MIRLFFASKTILPMLASLLLTVGCAHDFAHTSASATCGGVDWWEVGRTEGLSGTPLAKSLRESQSRCAASSSPVDIELYTNGHEAGLVEYCAPAQGLAAGRSGLPYENACPAHLEREFLKQYKAGRKLHSMELEHSSIAPFETETRAL